MAGGCSVARGPCLSGAASLGRRPCRNGRRRSRPWGAGDPADVVDAAGQPAGGCRGPRCGAAAVDEFGGMRGGRCGRGRGSRVWSMALDDAAGARRLTPGQGPTPRTTSWGARGAAARLNAAGRGWLRCRGQRRRRGRCRGRCRMVPQCANNRSLPRIMLLDADGPPVCSRPRGGRGVAGEVGRRQSRPPPQQNVPPPGKICRSQQLGRKVD